MTTIVGITANKGLGGVILASDEMATSTTWIPQGDVAYREQTRKEFPKIYIDENRMFAFSGAGIADEHYKAFVHDMITNKINVKKAFETEHFHELLFLNLGRFYGRVWNSENTNDILIASRLPDQEGSTTPKLFSCWPLGKVEKRFYTSIGSGSGYALEYLAGQNILSPNQIDLERAALLAHEALEAAAKDVYTGGANIVAVTREGIIELGTVIKDEYSQAKSRAKERIAATIRQLK